jgi:hypothetical protein
VFGEKEKGAAEAAPLVNIDLLTLYQSEKGIVTGFGTLYVVT